MSYCATLEVKTDTMSKKLEEYEKTRGVWFNGVTYDMESINNIKESIKDYPFWAYIEHKPDKETEESDKHFHLHFLLKANGSRSIKQVADSLSLPSNFIQKTKSKRSYGRYFIHLDNPEKIQYTIDNISCNKISQFKLWFQDNQDNDVRRLYSDLKKLRQGSISTEDFIDLHYCQLLQMPLYQQMRLLISLDEIASTQELPAVPAYSVHGTGVNR